MHSIVCTLMCMRTNIEIDDAVMDEAQRLTGARTKRETVDLALRELVARHRHHRPRAAVRHPELAPGADDPATRQPRAARPVLPAAPVLFLRGRQGSNHCPITGVARSS